MLAKSYRFHGRTSLNGVYRRGESHGVAGVRVKHMQNSNTPTFRAAVVVSKKVHKSAVVRNRIRRRVYEFIRLNSRSIQPHTDMVVQVFDETLASCDAQTVQKTLHSLFTKANIMH